MKELSDKWKIIMEVHRSQALSGFQKVDMTMCCRNVKKAKAKRKAWKSPLDLLEVNTTLERIFVEEFEKYI